MNLFDPFSFKEFGISDSGLTVKLSVSFLAGILLIMGIHETLHLVVVPYFGRLSSTYAGLSFLGAFIYSEEKISRTRLIILLSAPYTLISLAVPIIAGSIGVLNTELKMLILLNAAGSCTDLLTVYLLLLIPANTITTSRGNRTFWKNAGGE